jgi:two-component system, NtrC family, response regulator PilR
VRELENLLHRAVALSNADQLDAQHLGLPDSVFTDSAAQELDLITGNTRHEEVANKLLPKPLALPEQPQLPDNLSDYLDGVERDILERALDRHRFNRTAAGASLGLSLRQMRYRMARLGINLDADNDNERD